jgi:DNA-binding NarL/FixJ family response regulator
VSGFDGDGGLACEPAEPIRVLLADDQRVVREGLTLILDLLDDIEVLDAAVDGEQAVEMAERMSPDVVLMDLRMPRVDGIEAIRRLAASRPRIGVIALTTYADDASVLGALRAGARGYLTKDASAEQIHAAIARVANGEASLDEAIQSQVVEAVSAGGLAAAPEATAAGSQLPDDLTAREAEVLELIAGGLSNQEIAERLVVSPATVKSHVNHLFSKIGARDRAQAVRYAYRHGLVAEDS